MDDRDLLRYSRHILLNEFGVEAQAKLATASALVIGAGGLGSAALLYLASAGVSRIVVADGDTVDFTNLQRQIVHREDSVGVNKAVSAARTMQALNSRIEIVALTERLAGEALSTQVAMADVVLDCSDNFATRHAINRACVQHQKPLVSGAGIRFDGQIASFDLRDSESPCYHCLFAEPESGAAESEQDRCAIMGVFAPLVGIIGAMQAAEAIKLLAGVGKPLQGRLLMLEALTMQWQAVRLKRDPACAVCHQPVTENGYANV
ncbi:MAG: molybdopterin-synthase adenylyltransferase MoeB [Betaproteobacteria bacterium]|nr:molybdopterin-synthase adenylyltransferase MoeB [Betaproteobacteria bacterium]